MLKKKEYAKHLYIMWQKVNAQQNFLLRAVIYEKCKGGY
jgi:hypothetical protein